MERAIHMLITVKRTNKVRNILRSKYGFDIGHDMDTVQIVIDMIMQRQLSVHEVAEEIVEMHTISLEELFPA